MSSISAAAKNAMLDGLTITHASLHSTFPGSTGANEVSGGSYARKAITVGASSGGVRTMSGTATFDVPAAGVVAWVGYWNGTSFLFASPSGGATPKNFMTLASNDTAYVATHGWSDGQAVALFNGTPPVGITEGTVYYVRDATADTFKLAATVGGTAIDLTAGPSFGCVIAAITVRTYAAAGSFVLDTSTIVIPD